jgi:hypothetical protein
LPTRTKFAPHTTNSLVSLRATCAGLYFVVIGFSSRYSGAASREGRKTRASEFNKERAGWAQQARRHFYCEPSQMKGCMSALFPTNTSFEQKNLTKVIFKMSNQRRARTMGQRQRQQRRQRRVCVDRNEGNASLRLSSEIRCVATGFFHSRTERFDFSLRRSQSSADGCNTAANFIGSIALVLKLIFAAFYILLEKRKLLMEKRVTLSAVGAFICSFLTQGNCFYCWRHTAYFYCAAIQRLPFSQKERRLAN